MRSPALVAPLAFIGMLVSAANAVAQELVPGAFTPAPTGYNVVTVGGSISRGGVAFDPSLPIEDASARIGGTFVGLGRTLNLGGRFGNIVMSMPLVHGHLRGLVNGQPQEADRFGQGDMSVRMGINLFGARAMTRQEFAKYRPKTLVGVSAALGVPLGQYDSARYVNIGTNRWSLKLDSGFSRIRRRWTFEGDLGATFFGDNGNYGNGGTLEQAPIVSLQWHVIYTVRPGLWVAGDGNYWNGGRVTVNGVSNLEQQRNSRLGLTTAVPIGLQQVRIAYSFGAFTTIGGDFHSIGISYSYAWAGHP